LILISEISGFHHNAFWGLHFCGMMCW